MGIKNNPNQEMGNVFNKLSGQSEIYLSHFSPSNQYYAYLSKLEYDEDSDSCDIMFELMPYEWAQITIFNSAVKSSKLVPQIPTTCFQLVRISRPIIMQILGLADENNLAEGSWYLMELEKSDIGKLNGELYHPDIDHLPYTE